VRATYRLQLGPDLTFADARELVPYLRDLGISHLYLSPSLQAREGSTHGYDVVDPTRISEALGGEDGLRSLAAAAREAGMGIVLDVVPNHMANADENPFWADESKRAKFFDLDPETGRWRRFFDIDDLAGVRVEDPEVFETTHGKVLELVADGLVDGLRIDHPDGLADPAGYLRRLRERGVPHVWVEKIVDPGEHLRDWPVDGTTGYEFLNDVAALFVDPAGEEILTALHTEMTGDARPFGEVASEAKREQASTVFQPEVERLRRLHDAPGLVEALSSLPVYRTYVEPWSGRVEDADREVLDEAGIDEPLRSVLLLSDDTVPGEFVTRFQQTSPPIMAKGVEDTAFYRHVRLLALNDVGGDPSRFGIDVGRFHAANRERHERFPTAMLTSQTHDTKRSGDVRARIGALAGMAGEWAAAVRRWRSIAEPLRVDGAPDGQELLLILQTLVGAWPISAGRMQAYLEKALREAKRNTNWVDQNHAYEDGVRSFIATLLDHQPFLDDFVPFAERVAEAGERAALAQLLLKLTVPGFPDVYQGDELWSLSLVDPDNRRPVDWEQRRLALAELRAGAAATRETAKLDLITRTLDLRARRPESFGRSGAYQPIEAGDRACVFLRGSDVLVGVETLAGGRDGRLFAGTRIEGAWTDVLTGAPRELHRDTALDELLGPSGLCLLERRG
jgi:(1->4)-alpha-D-glucan 1-alpha-D-glucosylmutase